MACTGDLCKHLAAIRLRKRACDFSSKIFNEIKTSKASSPGFLSPANASSGAGRMANPGRKMTGRSPSSAGWPRSASPGWNPSPDAGRVADGKAGEETGWRTDAGRRRLGDKSSALAPRPGQKCIATPGLNCSSIVIRAFSAARAPVQGKFPAWAGC